MAKNILPIHIADLEEKETSKKNSDEEMLFSELVDEYMKRSELKNRILPSIIHDSCKLTAYRSNISLRILFSALLRRKETTCGTKENIILPTVKMKRNYALDLTEPLNRAVCQIFACMVFRQF